MRLLLEQKKSGVTSKGQRSLFIKKFLGVTCKRLPSETMLKVLKDLRLNIRPMVRFIV